MTSRYQPLEKPRFSIETGVDGEVIRIRAPKQIFAMLFLPVWLAGWTAGGGMALWQVFTHFDLFLVFWLCMWAFGWAAAAGTLLWMSAGSETLRVTGGDLEIAHRALGFSRSWLYQGAQIRNLGVAPQPAWPFRFRWQVPFVRMRDGGGAVRFDYGARTVSAAAGLDEAEGQMIVERLAKRLPGAR